MNSNLKGTLHFIANHPTGFCDEYQVKTVQHVLVGCRKYVLERRNMMKGMCKSGLKGAHVKDSTVFI